MMLAIGISSNYTWSISIDSQNPKLIAQELYAVNCDQPDQIILIAGDLVIGHYLKNKDY